MKNNKSTKANVPNLRFPEFEREWKTRKIKDVMQLISGGTPSMQCPQYWGGDIPLISAISMHQTYISSSSQYITEVGLKNGSKLLPKNNLMLLVRGSMLWNRIPICYNLIDVAFNQDVKGLIPNSKSTSSFALYWFQSKETLLKNMVTDTGIGAGKLDTDNISSLPIDLPNIDEQIKITTFFSSLDQRIETQSQIIENLESLIKGLIQSFVYGNRIGWKKTYLRDVLRERRELNINSYPIYSVAVRKGVINQIEHLGRSFAARNTTNYSVVRHGDIIYTKSPTGSFPYGIIKQSFVEHPVAVSPLYGVYTPVNIYLGNILHHFFNSPVNANNYLHSLIQKGAKNTISITNQRFLDKELLLPSDAQEIKQIHFLLSAIQKKIDMENSIKAQLVKQKKYLLNQMFI